MQVYSLDPLSDQRWSDFAASYPGASVFHQSGWLRALASTYGYRPIVLTSTPPNAKLQDGLIFCEVKSLITGNRLVSLPFSDHAEPLRNGHESTFDMAKWIHTESARRHWKYVELRPVSGPLVTDYLMTPSRTFWLHTLDLSPPVNRLFQNLHKNSAQRRIRHAERQNLVYEKGSSAALVDEFYDLLIKSRRRLLLLPQPRVWFQNLMACTNAEIRMVWKDGTAIAAILTLRHRGTVVYKYGCSNEKFHHLAGMPYLFWRLIEESKADNMQEIDFGRTDLDNHGLIRFKEQLGTMRRRINYFRSAELRRGRIPAASDFMAARKLCSVLPDSLSAIAGTLIYRHIA